MEGRDGNRKEGAERDMREMEGLGKGMEGKVREGKGRDGS